MFEKAWGTLELKYWNSAQKRQIEISLPKTVMRSRYAGGSIWIHAWTNLTR